MNFKHELSPSKPLLRSTQSIILGLISFETNPSKVRGFAENKEILAFEIVNVSPETCFE